MTARPGITPLALSASIRSRHLTRIFAATATPSITCAVRASISDQIPWGFRFTARTGGRSASGRSRIFQHQQYVSRPPDANVLYVIRVNPEWSLLIRYARHIRLSGRAGPFCREEIACIGDAIELRRQSNLVPA